jgi:hypothetical protein
VEFANGDVARNEARAISRFGGARPNESAPETGALRCNQRFTSASLHIGRVMRFKNSMMLTAPRIFGLITLLAPDAVQTAWEAEGIVFWPTPREISLNFEQKILSAILDFSDAVRRVVIIGNMMVLLQVPAGKVTLRNNQKKFCGLVQLRSVLFRRDKITYLLFQQDLMYHLAQTRT